MNTPPAKPPRPLPDDDKDEDWGQPPGKAEDLRDQGPLESLGEAVSEVVKGTVPNDPVAEALARRKPGGAT